MLTSWFYPFPSGSANRFYEIGKRLARDHEVHVYTTSMDRPREERIEGIHVHRYGRISPSQSLEKGVAGANLKFSIETMRRIAQDAKKHRFDIIDCNITSKILPFVSFTVSKLNNIPLVQTWHEVWYTYNFIQYNILTAPIATCAEFIIPRFATNCIAVSNTTKRRLVDLLGISEEKIVVIPNGVDSDVFERLNVKKDGARLVYIGRLESHKKVDILIQAFKLLKEQFPEIELIIIGEGTQKKSLIKLSTDLGLNNVTFLGMIPRAKLLNILKSSTLLVLPSILEGQGVVLLEAMAAGTPPIAIFSTRSGVKDVVRHKFNGLLVGSNVKDIEMAVSKLLTHPLLYKNIRDNALKYVKDFDWNSIANRVSELYANVIEDKINYA